MGAGSKSRAELARTLERTGYNRLVRRHGHVRPNYTQDLSVPEHPVPLSNGFGAPTPRRPPLPPDAKQFPVGNSHKQGLELITPGSNPADYNGAKK